MDTIKVLVTMPFPDYLIEKIENASSRISVTRHEARKSEDLPQNAADFDVFYGLSALPAPEVMPNLKWVQMHSAGVDPVLLLPLYNDTDIVFTTTSGLHAVTMAEYTLGQILAYAHHLPRMYEDQANGKWPAGRWDRYVPRNLRGQTLGIVGYGSIGREIARQAQAFGLKVLAVKRDLRNLIDNSFRIPDTGDPEAEIPDRIYPVEALNSFLAECDYVVLATPLTPDTHHLIGERALNAMKEDALLINISRGDVIDENALIDALEKGKIGGAALDVFQKEPLPDDSPLWKMPNVTLSPHVSGFTPAYDDLATDIFVENIKRFVAGEALLNVVDRSRNY